MEHTNVAARRAVVAVVTPLRRRCVVVGVVHVALAVAAGLPNSLARARCVLGVLRRPLRWTAR